MATTSLTLCDVKSCNLTADREFQINGRTVYVCGEGCYVKYWSREYQAWKEDPYELRTSHTVKGGEPHSSYAYQRTISTK